MIKFLGVCLSSVVFFNSVMSLAKPSAALVKKVREYVESNGIKASKIDVQEFGNNRLKVLVNPNSGGNIEYILEGEDVLLRGSQTPAYKAKKFQGVPVYKDMTINERWASEKPDKYTPEEVFRKGDTIEHLSKQNLELPYSHRSSISTGAEDGTSEVSLDLFVVKVKERRFVNTDPDPRDGSGARADDLTKFEMRDVVNEKTLAEVKISVPGKLLQESFQEEADRILYKAIYRNPSGQIREQTYAINTKDLSQKPLIVSKIGNSKEIRDDGQFSIVNIGTGSRPAKDVEPTNQK